MVFEKLKNYHILRYIIYEFLKKFSVGPWPTCLVKILCALERTDQAGSEKVTFIYVVKMKILYIFLVGGKHLKFTDVTKISRRNFIELINI